MEYAEGQELYYKIVDCKRLDENTARGIFRQLVSAVMYLHENNLAHRDIKPENIMVNSRGKIKLVDFGFVRLTPANAAPTLNTVCGSLSYCPPEVIRKKPYCGKKADIWCLGITLFTMLVGKRPFTGATLSEILQDIEQKDFDSMTSYSSGENILTNERCKKSHSTNAGKGQRDSPNYSTGGPLFMDKRRTFISSLKRICGIQCAPV